MKNQYDFIIVGGGTSGIITATKLIEHGASVLILEEGIRPWGNEFGANQFGGFFFMVTGFHGLHVSIGVVYLTIVAKRVLDGRYDKLNDYQMVEVAGLYWHFVDLVWIFIFAFFYLW